MAALAILFAFSISFKPEPGEKGLQTLADQLPGARAAFGPSPLTYTVEDFKQINEGKPAWEGVYRYTLLITEADLPAENEDLDEDEKPKKKDKDKKQPSMLRIIVLATLIQEKDLDQLNEEDRKLRDRVERRGGEIFQGGKLPTQKQMRKLNEVLIRESENLTDRQLERFLTRVMATSGTLDTTELKLTSHKEREYRFAVEAKAKPDAIRTWPHDINYLFGADKLATMGVGDFIYLFQDRLVGGLGASVAMLLGAIITAFFIPNMLRKGTIDLLIAKPIHRWSLLTYKYVGGMLFVLIPTVVVVVGIWLAFGLRSGFWGTGFLMSIPLLTIQFAIFYAISTLVAVLTRSPILCILACCFAWFVLWGTAMLEWAFRPSPGREKDAGWVYKSSATTRKLLPRYKDFDAIASQMVAHDLLGKDSSERKRIDKENENIRWGESLGITFGYIALMLSLSCWYFARKDY